MRGGDTSINGHNRRGTSSRAYAALASTIRGHVNKRDQPTQAPGGSVRAGGNGHQAIFRCARTFVRGATKVIWHGVWAVLMLSAGADRSAAAVLQRHPDGPPPKCAIEIEFRLRRGEIDGMTLVRVLQFAETAPVIKHVYDGRERYEDPPMLCLVIDRENDALVTFEKLTGIVPVPRVRLPRLPPAPPVVLRYKGEFR